MVHIIRPHAHYPQYAHEGGHREGRVGGREGGREGGRREGEDTPRRCTSTVSIGTHEWSISLDHMHTTHSMHMRGGGGREGGGEGKGRGGRYARGGEECTIILKGWGERENTTLTCTCMLYRHRSHTYCCVGG